MSLWISRHPSFPNSALDLLVVALKVQHCGSKNTEPEAVATG